MTSPGSNPIAAALAVLTNATLWGLAWLPFKTLGGLGLHPLWSTAGAFGLALTVMLAWRPANCLQLLRHRRLWALALAAGLTNLCFNWALAIGDVVRVVLLFYLMPVWSVGVAWLLVGERPTWLTWARLSLALVGVALVLQRPGAGWPLPTTLAEVLGLAGGFFFAVTTVLLRRWGDLPETGRATAIFVGAFGLSLGLAISGVATPLPAPEWSTVLWLLALAVIFFAGNLGLQYGASRLKAQTTAILMLFEVVVAALSSFLLGAAHPSPTVWLGGSLIIFAALLAVRR